jgi:hypothetical protein
MFNAFLGSIIIVNLLLAVINVGFFKYSLKVI